MAIQGLKTVTQIEKAIKETTKTTPYSIAIFSGCSGHFSHALFIDG